MSDFPEFDAQYRTVLIKDKEDRFEQLAAEANFNVYHSDIWRGTGRKFAELIVQECIKVMYDNAIERQVPPNIEKTPTHYAVAILEHFKIQETKREKFDRAIKETFGFGADLSGKETP
jgi:hypothetical protein